MSLGWFSGRVVVGVALIATAVVMVEARPVGAVPVQSPAGKVTLSGRASATEAGGPGYVQALPCSATPGGYSNLNIDHAGQTIAALAFVHFDAFGLACLYTQTTTHLVADIQGYMNGGAFDDITDTRVLDTRHGTKPVDSTRTPLHGRPSSTAVVSIIATEADGPGFVQALPCGTPAGGYSNLNVDHAGQTIASLAFVHFDAGGQACLYNQTGTHLVADIQGYMTGGAFDDTPDVRVLDTRQGGGCPAVFSNGTVLADPHPLMHDVTPGAPSIRFVDVPYAGLTSLLLGSGCTLFGISTDQAPAAVLHRITFSTGRVSDDRTYPLPISSATARLLALDPDETSAYVFGLRSGTTSAVVARVPLDGSAPTITSVPISSSVSSIELAPPYNGIDQGQPRQFAISRDGTSLFEASIEGGGADVIRLRRVTVATGAVQVLPSVPNIYHSIPGLWVSPDGRYVCNGTPYVVDVAHATTFDPAGISHGVPGCNGFWPNGDLLALNRTSQPDAEQYGHISPANLDGPVTGLVVVPVNGHLLVSFNPLLRGR